MTQVSRQNGGTPQLSSATYSPTGKTLTATDPNSHVTTYTYDLLDRLATVTDAESRLTATAYDTLSRLASVTNTAIQPTPLLQQSYTANGRLASLTDALSHATSFAYDGLDRLSTTTYPLGSTEVLAYDADSNVASLTTRAGATIQYGYDNLNRRTSKTPPAPAPVVTYAYDLASRLTGVSDTSTSIPTVAVPGGGSGVQYTSYFYFDALNRLSGTIFDSVNAMAVPPTSSVELDHWYNKVNQRTYQTVSDNTYWSYPANSASSVSYSANSLNQYTAVGATAPSYDGNGNLTSDGTFTYTYDAENRLVSASGAGNTASYAYDASGRRKSKTVNGTTTLYLSDGDREVLEYDGGGTVLRRYTHGRGIDEVLNLVNADGSRAILVPDIQGSLIASVDSSTGTITRQGVQAYGESADASGSFRYTGRRIDAETLGLYYYRARMYSPGLGRFMQPDPIGYRGGSNLYSYVGNDSLNLTDPTGLSSESQQNSGSGFGSLSGPSSGGSPAYSLVPGVQLAQYREDIDPEEILDPMAPVRTAEWNSGINTLRQLDPANRQLTYVAPPGAPSNEAIARLYDEIQTVATQRVSNFVMPGGNPIGEAGNGRDIRVVPGGATAAQDAFNYLSVGGINVTPSGYAGTLIRLPSNAGYIGLRSSSSGPAIDINVPGVPYRTLHY